MSRKEEKKGISAWLVTWQGTKVDPDKKAVAILNPRWGGSRVKEYVELLYYVLEYTFSDQAQYAKQPKNNPYPAKFAGGYEGQISCGHNPFLSARLVDNLVIEDQKIISWENRPKPENLRKTS